MSIQPSPPLPPSGITACKRGADGRLLGLGNQAFPFLYQLTSLTSGTLTMIAGPLPGDPVDFADTSVTWTYVDTFGAPCGTPTLAMGAVSMPILGNSAFLVNVTGGLPNQAALLVAGFDDLSAFATTLPLLLPGGCPLHTAPDTSILRITTVSGAASVGLPIPNLPALLGATVFAQWLQAQGAAVIVSSGLVLRIGRAESPPGSARNCCAERSTWARPVGAVVGAACLRLATLPASLLDGTGKPHNHWHPTPGWSGRSVACPTRWARAGRGAKNPRVRRAPGRVRFFDANRPIAGHPLRNPCVFLSPPC